MSETLLIPIFIAITLIAGIIIGAVKHELKLSKFQTFGITCGTVISSILLIVLFNFITGLLS